MVEPNRFEPAPPPIQEPSVSTTRTVDDNSVSARYRKRVRRPKMFLLVIVAPVIAAGIAITSFSSWMSGGNSFFPFADPNKAAVRSYLRENLNEPKWEEVEWHIAPQEPDRDCRMVYLKYRTRNRFGALEIAVNRFDVKNGEVVHRVDGAYMPSSQEARSQAAFMNVMKDLLEREAHGPGAE